ncbi:TldD/PmbA family protein [Thermosulfuriphilus sp.]
MKFSFDPEKVLARMKGIFAELYYEESTTTQIILEDDRLERLISGTDTGLGLRRLYDRFQTAYAYTNDLSSRTVLALAEDLARIKGPVEAKGRKLDITKVPPIEISRPPEQTPVADKIDLLRRANTVARALSPKVRQVKVIYQDRRQRLAIINSEGQWLEGERTYVVLAVQVVASDGETIQTGYESSGGTIGLELFESHPPEEVAKVATNRALLMLSARRAPGGIMPVVISAQAGGTMIHEAVGHGLEADLAEEGFSVYAGKVGQQVASPLVTVVDDATLVYQRGSYQFDDEGVISQKVVLIENGILKDFLYDRVSALKAGRASNGHGRRESYRFRPIPRMGNTYIAPGNESPESIIRSTHRGLLVKKMGGGQVDTINGNFVFEVAEGYLIENGEIGDPVRGATLTGNGPEVLKIIDKVGNDLGWGIGTCGKDGQGVPVADAQPTIRIPEMVVGGAVK